MINYKGFRILTVGWMMLIFLPALPDVTTRGFSFPADLVAHAAFYGVLGVLARSLAPPQGMTWKRDLS